MVVPGGCGREQRDSRFEQEGRRGSFARLGSTLRRETRDTSAAPRNRALPPGSLAGASPSFDRTQLAAQVGRPSCQDEGDEDAFPVLPANDVEAQARGALVQQHLPRLPAKQSDSVRVKGSTESTEEK
ncbi:hypothetical protein EYF80_051617 [Liparis tanakae]|uniref:Uncharacterized protein n=1 Tax=Liparis tanakae TaxID=230148 RepID=A0A4Z2FAK4_9TELE|nr:hypothetical protein EYF80_051617 [Liparis tanakae]